MTRGTMAALMLASGICFQAVPATAESASVTGTGVSGAKTAAEHEALAATYDEEAAQAKAQAGEHRRMAEAYKGQAAVTGGKVTAASAMPQHCAALAKTFDEQAKMYGEMAAGERALAKVAH